MSATIVQPPSTYLSSQNRKTVLILEAQVYLHTTVTNNRLPLGRRNPSLIDAAFGAASVTLVALTWVIQLSFLPTYFVPRERPKQSFIGERELFPLGQEHSLRVFGVAGFEGFEDGRVGEGGDVAESPPGGDVAQEPPHDLPAAGFGQVGGKNNALGAGEGAGLLHHVFFQLVHQLGVLLRPVPRAL